MAPFVFSSEVFCLVMTLYLVWCFSSVLGMLPDFKMYRSMPWLQIFLIFTSDLKKVIKVNFTGVVHIKCRNKSSRKSFSIHFILRLNVVLTQ